MCAHYIIKIFFQIFYKDNYRENFNQNSFFPACFENIHGVTTIVGTFICTVFYEIFKICGMVINNISNDLMVDKNTHWFSSTHVTVV